MNKRKTFNLLLVAQSLSAFGDNAAYSVIMGMLLASVQSGRVSLAEFGVAAALFANCLFLPYIVFAPVLGWISDRFPKRNVLIFANSIKALGACFGLAGIMTGTDLMVVSYLIIGMGAAIYSPSKYGIIPELKDEKDLVKANAAIEMTTIFSILIGIIGGSLMVDHIGGRNSFTILVCVFVAASFFNTLMDKSNTCNKEETIRKSMGDFTASLKGIFHNRFLYVPILGTSIFWTSASFIKLNLQTWGQSVVKLSTATKISLLALWLSIGIIIGSFIAGKLFKTGQIRQSWKFGLGMGVIILAMVLNYSSYGLLMIELILIGALGGLFLIPLNAEIQAQSDTRNIGKVIAIQNFIENGSMLSSAAAFWYLNKISFSPTVTFVIIGGFLCLVNVLWLNPFLRNQQKPCSGRTSPLSMESGSRD